MCQIFFEEVCFRKSCTRTVDDWFDDGGERGKHDVGRQHFGERREEKEKGEVASLSGWRYVTG